MKALSVRRFLCGVAGALAFAASAFAQQAAQSGLVPPAFGLLSLVGDKFSGVFRREEIGSRIDPNVFGRAQGDVVQRRCVEREFAPI